MEKAICTDINNILEPRQLKPFEERFVKEYQELKERYTKLKVMLYKYKNNMLDFTPKCSYELLRQQQEAMGKYLGLLEERAIIEDIPLPIFG